VAPVVWTLLGPLPRWAPGTARLALHGT
jgi:hypothetical protein